MDLFITVILCNTNFDVNVCIMLGMVIGLAIKQIETDRLILRPFCIDDISAFAGIIVKNE